MRTSDHVVPHRGIASATRYVQAAPAVAAFFYPVALVAFYSGGRLVHDASTWASELSGWIVTLGAAILAYGVPAMSFWIIYVLGQQPAPNQAQVRARCLAHLAFASPPVFTALGVVAFTPQLTWTQAWCGGQG
jgi:hypothetical protein